MDETTCRVFLDRLGMQALRSGLGCPTERPTPDVWLRCACLELGQVAAALSRERYELAAAECIDLAHAAMLLWGMLQLGQKEKT